MRAIHRYFIHILAGWALCCGIAHAQNPPAEESFPLKIDGDIGVGVYYTRSIIRDRRESALVLPYAYFDYGRLFARIDTFGVKTVKIGYGYLELAGRVELDGFKTNTPGLQGLHGRKNSLPLGIGTMQETPVGALFVNAFHDVSPSSGNLFDATYIASFTMQRITVYPQAGVEYLSKRYVDYYYGVLPQEANGSRYGRYQPGGALNPFVAAMLEIKIAADWNLNVFARHKWLAGAIHNSPIAGSKGMDTVFASLAYRFK
jgi:outer membrane protein